jgi:phospholipid-translocating ATPase
VEVDGPTTKIYRFHGAIVHPSGERVPVGTENLLLRECVLKNTDFVEGIVVYAGRIHPVCFVVTSYQLF